MKKAVKVDYNTMDLEEQRRRNMLNSTIEVMIERGVYTEQKLMGYLLRSIKPTRAEDFDDYTGNGMTYEQAVGYYRELTA